MFVAFVIMFSLLKDRFDSDFLQIVLHFITSLNNSRQLNDSDLEPNSFC